LASDMTDAQIEGVDYELARLAELLPADDEFYLAIRDNLSATGDSWSSDQVWRAVGVALQLASIVTGIIKWLAGKTAKLTKSIAVITKKAKTLTPSQAKRLDEIDNQLRQIQKSLEANPKPREAEDLRAKRTTLQNERNHILNKTDLKNPEELSKAKTVAYTNKQIQEAQKELDDAKAALQRRLDWEAKQTPGGLKNDLQSKNSAGRLARDKLRVAEQKMRDLGQDVTPMDFRSVDDILGTPPKTTPKVDDVADTVKPKSISQIKDELDEVFNTRVSNILSKLDNGNIEFRSEYYPKSKLTDAEWALLNEDLKAKGLKLVDSGDKYQIGATDETIKKAEKIRDAKRAAEEAEKKAAEEAAKKAEEARIKSMQNHENASINVGKGHTYTPKNHVSGTVDTTNKVDDAGRATNAATDGARTANATADAAQTTSRATNATTLQSAKDKLYTYGQTFDKTIDDFLYRNGGYPASWRRADLTDAEFDVLRTDLHSRGLSLDTDPDGFCA